MKNFYLKPHFYCVVLLFNHIRNICVSKKRKKKKLEPMLVQSHPETGISHKENMQTLLTMQPWENNTIQMGWCLILSLKKLCEDGKCGDEHKHSRLGDT